MEINRNQYFMVGIIILVLGLQIRAVDSLVLTPKAGHFIATRMNKNKSVASAMVTDLVLQAPASLTRSKRTVHPPEWLGWALISIGSVLVLHSLALRRPA